MVRWVVVGVLGAALVAAVGVFALYPACCGDDDDSPGGSVTATAAVATSPGATAPGDDELARLEYSLKVIDWGESLRTASLVIAEQIAAYGQEISALGEQTRRDTMETAFETVAAVRAEYGQTIPPHSLLDDHERLGESLASFGDAQESVNLAYIVYDAGGTAAAAAPLHLSNAVDSMNNAIAAMNKVISDVSNPEQ